MICLLGFDLQVAKPRGIPSQISKTFSSLIIIIWLLITVMLGFSCKQLATPGDRVDIHDWLQKELQSG